MTWHDLNRFFHLGTVECIWKVVEVMEETALCNMVGTDDCVVLHHQMLVPLLREYEEYWQEVMWFGE